MAILLAILKWTGILLLALLGLILLLLALVLLVPVRYQLKGRFQEQLRARGEISWLLRLFRFSAAAINLQILGKLKLLGFCLKKWHIGNWDREEEALGVSAGEKEAEKRAEAEAEKKKEAGAQEKARKKAAETKTEKEEDKAGPAPSSKAEEYDKLFQELSEEQEQKEKQEAPYEEEKKLLETIKEWMGKLNAFWEDEKNREAAELIWRQLMKLARHLAPSVLRIEGRIGLEDPAATGMLVGWVYRFYPLYGDHIRLEGVFDEQLIQVYLELKGRVRLGIFAEVLLRLFLNKRCRRWVAQLRKKDKDSDQDTERESLKAA